MTDRSETQSRDLASLCAADFEPHVRTAFHAPVDGDEGIDLELIEVSGLTGDTPEDSQRQPFSITLRGPKDRVFEQQMCTLEHPGLGNLQLFLVPLGPDDDGMRYEAVFS